MNRSAGVFLGVLLLAHGAAAEFTQQWGKLVGTGASFAAQGHSVAISADGNTAIVGGPWDNVNAGAAWVFTRSDGVWAQQGGKLVGTGAATGPSSNFILQGSSVAISADGNTAIVGGPGDGNGLGAVWVFARSDGAWAQQGDKLVGTGASWRSGQGSSVAVSGDGNTVIVGGPGDDSDLGAVWVFTRSDGVWSQQGSKLVGKGFVGGAGQGSSVALSADGKTAIVGGPGGSGSPGSGQGAVWVYTRSGNAWTQQGGALGGTDAVGASAQGSSVAISADGNTAIVGGSGDGVSGATWVYTRSAGAWSQQGNKLVGTGASGGAAQGSSVAVSADGSTAIVGGRGDNSYLGAAWVFTRGDGVWAQQGNKLVGSGFLSFSSLEYNVEQGSSVGLSADGTTAIVGGPMDDNDVGAAWVFSTTTWRWVPVASHNSGLNQSQWRSDLGVLNRSAATASVGLAFSGPAGVVTNTTYVPPGTQSILTDVVGQLGGSGSGALEIVSDQPLEVTARTYNQVSSAESCYPNGTQGQEYPVLAAGDGLGTGQSAVLPGLTENASYRCNIGVIDIGAGPAVALVDLFDGAGSHLGSYTVPLAAGQWAQATQPFLKAEGQTAMDSGYATVTVQSGSGVFAFGSVIDNLTNDPTTVTMRQAAGTPFTQQGGKLVGTGAVDRTAGQGDSVAISADGSTAIVGGSGISNVSLVGVGAAWVYTRSGSVWSQQGNALVGDDVVGPAAQGSSVAISADGNTAIVGAFLDNSSLGSGAVGAGFVYTRSGGVWSQQGAKLVGTGAVGFASQGISVAISADGNTAVVGGFGDNFGLGAAWVFTRSGGTWSQQGNRLVGTGAVGGASQGHAVAISADGSTVIIGGPYDDSGVGAAWVFRQSGGAWLQQGGKLVGSGAVNVKGFGVRQGYSVAISADGSTAIVAGSEDNGGVGAAWVYTRNGGVWTQEGGKLVGAGAVSVGISGDGNTAIVSAPGGNSGVVESVYTRNGGVWTQQGGSLVGTGAVDSSEGLGGSVAISEDGNTVIGGGPSDGAGAGAAWVFSTQTWLWVPVASHNPGLNGTQWRTALGVLNSGTVTANVQLAFFGSDGVVGATTSLPPGAQAIVPDVVGQLGGTGSGSLEVSADRPVEVAARTYNQIAPTASCYADGTQGQDYPAVISGSGLVAGQSAFLAGLTENASYRCNIGVVNTGAAPATVLVQLYDGAGNALASYTVALAVGQWSQATQPFLNDAGQTAMDRGYATITVQSGAGVFAFASVIDNMTNDPTTVVMQP